MAEGKILIVDDEPQIIELYEKWLGEEGYAIRIARSVPEARAILANETFDVTLLDQRLPGSPETEGGLDLVAEAATGGCRVFMVTGHPAPDAVEKAYRRGAYDYIQKGRIAVMRPLLKLKVRRAMELVATERAASRTPDERDRHIRQLWATLPTITNSHAKGRQLEELLAEIFRTVPGFVVHPHERSDDEEIDLFITNQAGDWVQESPFILVETKNWTKKVEPIDYVWFMRKLEQRAGRARLGFLVSIGGFTAGVHTNWTADRPKPELVVLVDREDLEQIVVANDRNAALHELHRRAVVRR